MPRAWMKRLMATVAVLVLAAMAFHGVAHASEVGHDDCPACAVGAAKTAGTSAPAFVRVLFLVAVAEPLPQPCARPALKFRATARPPPRA